MNEKTGQASEERSEPNQSGGAGPQILTGGGAMGALMRSLDWSQTPLGPVESWPQSLRSALSICLGSSFPIAIYWGPQLALLYNDAWKPIPGGKHPWSLGRGAREVWPEIWDTIGPLFDQVLVKGEATYSEDSLLPMYRHGYLEECYYNFTFSPIRGEAGDVEGVFNAVIETTYRVISERRARALRELGERTTAARSAEEACTLAAGTLGSATHDVPFCALYLIDEVAHVARLTACAGLLSGSPEAPEVLPLDEGVPAVWPLAQARRSGQVEMVTGLDERFGSPLPGGAWPEPAVSALIAPLLTATNQVSGFLIVGASPRRAVDDQYRQFVERAAAQVSTVISSARAYEAERQRAEALAELDRAKTAFFSNVSHEFRTPLTLMLGPVEDSLADTAHPLSPEQRERQELVRRNALRLQKLVNTLLDFSRIEAGRAQVSFVPTDLSALTRDLVSSFDSAMTSGGLRLVVDCPALPAPVSVDPSMWEKIVLNLLSNALKFTFKGEVRVALRWRGESVELTVQDTGTGISAAELPRIFERFHRVEGARGRSHEGTGIGLALVQELVKLHGGQVSVTSELGQGSTFTVSLPTGEARVSPDHAGARALIATGIGADSFLAEASQWNASPETSPTPPAPQAEAPSALHTGARLVVVDDNADMRHYLTRLLSPHWTVEVFNDGAQALAAARANPPDLVLSDVMMPGLGGLELVQALRADERTRTIPVMLLSARAGEEATIEGLQSGADEYLVKPFSANELIARVNAQLTVSRLRLDAVRAAREHAQETAHLLEESRQATRAREEMLAVVSHDLRSPLTAIRAASDLLHRRPGEGKEGARVLKQTTTISRAAIRMDRLIGDLLDLASIDAGTLSLDLQPLPMETLLRELQTVFEPQAAEKGLQLTVDAPTDLPSLTVDRERLFQVLSNLVSNAIKFTGPGGRVLVRAQQQPEGLRFSVSDTGVGIAPESLKHVFDRYWHSQQKGREGHGLGLSIAQGIVEAHGGVLRADSEPGKGSTFTFSLPITIQARVVAPVVPFVPNLNPLPTPTRADENFMQAGGQMGALMRSLDWSRNSLGPVDQWPQSLRTSVSTMLRSPYPIILFWGPELRMLYNDPFRPILGAKHPQTMGARGYEALAEEWTQLGPLMQRVHDTGEPLFIENGNVNFERRPGGLREEAYFTWSYNPTIGESGEIAGLFAIASETTRQVVGDRRLAILRELSIRAALDKKVEGIFRSLEDVLSQAGHDLPFALLYVVKGDKAHLVSCAGLSRGAPAAPVEQPLNDAVWPLESVVRSGQEALLTDLHLKFGALPGGPWPEASTRALVLPVPLGADRETMGVLVAGLSPLSAVDDEYRSFLQLLARQLASSISSARAYEQERQRAEELARLDQAKTAFFSNISHEFRTPLTLILGPVGDALTGASRSLSGEKLDLVRRNALRLYKMVNTLLDFARMEAGRAQATYAPTELCTFTTNLASAFQSAIESAGLKLIVNCEQLPEAVYVDPEMWEKIVLNLLSNAVKYTYQGEIRVGLTWEHEQAVLTVKDTGVGIPSDDLPRVFDRFYRVRMTQGRSHEGTGIGLALVQELVKLHGGQVSATSALGEGSTFTVRLPRGSAHLPVERVDETLRPRSAATGAAPFVAEARRWSIGDEALETNESTAETSDEAARQVSPELRQARILLVDDNADLRSYVSGLLARVFPRVETATNGQEALEQARANPPDLVLSDVMMPGLDGFGLVRALRADERTRSIPIILLSARAGDEATVEGLGSGADDYVVKPFAARELLARVRTQLEMARIRRAAVRHEVVEEQLRATLKVRDEWLTVVSHELRTPLSALTLSVQSLLRIMAAEERAETSPEARKSKIHTTERHLHRLKRQVEQLVDTAGVVSGDLTLTKEKTDLSEVAATMVESVQAQVARTGCALTLRADTPVVGLYDRDRVRQLLEGLLDNALKFGAGRPVDVSVQDEADEATIRVVDHGGGVAPEDQDRIFGRFERAAPTKHHGGFGLGLWLAQHIAAAHGGRIQLTPTEGGGATFTVRLPRDSMAH